MKIFSPTLRRFPYPYKSMLSICSDLDETPDKQTYLEIMKYLNTTDTTAMGNGVGLEIGNTIYFDMPENQFSYWNTDKGGQEMVRSLIHTGHIDCLHSFGDFATTRNHAKRALEELTRYNCKLEVWIDHATAPSNFGADIMQGYGDIPGAEAYHADLSFEYGIRYVWCGRVTSIIGQQIPRKFGGLWNKQHPLISCKTLSKEMIKGILAKLGNAKYEFHGHNNLFRKIRLRNGQECCEFLRSNPYWGGVDAATTADGLGQVLTDNMLEHLINHSGFCILYTHLGKVKDKRIPFGPHTTRALKTLAGYYERKQILVATTRRLLDYCLLINELEIDSRQEGDWITVNITTKHGHEKDLSGLTIYTINKDKTRVFTNGKEVSNLLHNDPDETGVSSVSLPWNTLEFPNL